MKISLIYLQTVTNIINNPFVYQITNSEIEHNVQILMQMHRYISFHCIHISLIYIIFILLCITNGNFPLFFDIIFRKIRLLLKVNICIVKTDI